MILRIAIVGIFWWVMAMPMEFTILNIGLMAACFIVSEAAWGFIIGLYEGARRANNGN